MAQLILQPIRNQLILFGEYIKSLVQTFLVYLLGSVKVTMDSFSVIAEEAVLFQAEMKQRANNITDRIKSTILVYVCLYIWIWVIGLFFPRLSNLGQTLFLLHIAYQIGLINNLFNLYAVSSS